MSRRHPSSSCWVGLVPVLGVGPGMWNTRDTPPLPERIGWVATPIYHDLGHHATLCCATTSAIVKLSDANPQGGQRRQSTQTLAAVMLLIGRSQRLKKTDTPQRKPPKVQGQDHLPEEPAFVTFQRGLTFLGPRPVPDLLPEEHSESATRGLWLSGQRRTQVLLVSDMWDTL